MDELVEELEVGLALLVAQDGGIRGDEGGEFVGEFAGFDAVAGGVGFAGFGFGTLGFGSVFAGDLGFFFFGWVFRSMRISIPLGCEWGFRADGNRDSVGMRISIPLGFE